MNVEKRDGRGAVGQRAPRSGGRTTAQRTTRDTTTAGGREGTRARGTRDYPTEGSAALRPAERSRTTAPAAPRLRVAPPPPIRVPRAPFVGLILVLVVGGVLGILAVNTKINENAFRLERLQQQQAKLDVDEQELKKEIADQEAPGNLTANARKLGLVESADPAYIRLPDGETIGVPHPAEGGTAGGQQGNGG
ncbi:hypothetical protein O7602_07305 [Micromonospora sp. WMMD1128]|uniref:hypothetical protein n=1 Tax=unclassified Micromonospora TaxID=2617518 RepID=UPI00248CD5F8|nr:MULTISPECIES: hypothetical protein [unclassified Micromonospora]WBB75316.1 hypothetical protein O7602_07305 [Micromonospora sp. WMMD1128]WFE31297.1 hypothetical protein O7613_16850 [Micromonospora sp. WMMD975]